MINRSIANIIEMLLELVSPPIMGIEPVTAALLTTAVAGGAGAMSGLSSKLGMSKEKKAEPVMSPEQKSQASASQALIPFYLQMLSGGMPDFLKRYLMQTRGTLEQSNRGQMSDYLRQIGSMGMDFGPQQAAQLGGMYGGMTPALTGALTQARLGMTQGAVKGLQDWSNQSYPVAQPPAKQPSFGAAAGAGALGSIGSMMGGMKTGGGGSNQKVNYPGAPYTPQYAQSSAANAYGGMMQSMAPNVPPQLYSAMSGLYPSMNVNPSGFTDMSGRGNYGPAMTGKTGK